MHAYSAYENSWQYIFHHPAGSGPPGAAWITWSQGQKWERKAEKMGRLPEELHLLCKFARDFVALHAECYWETTTWETS